MKRVVVVCEGQTEQAFSVQVLLPQLVEKNVLIEPQLIRTSPSQSGGSLTSARVVQALNRIIRQQSNAYVTTFFDLYGMRPNFPGYENSAKIRDPVDRVEAIEAEFHQVVIKVANCRSERFIPYIQPYEFEALLFSDVTKFAQFRPNWQPFSPVLKKIRDTVSSPEHINDGFNTHPSARILKLLTDPYYNKTQDGPRIAALIGLTTIRKECTHFGRWVQQLENLPSL